MELIKLFWIVNFFLFSIILFFVWSKMFLVGKKIQKSTAMIEEIDKVNSQIKQLDGVDSGTEKPGTPSK